MYMNIYIYVHRYAYRYIMYIYIHIYICMYIHVYICIYIYICTFIHIYIYTYTYVCTCTYMYVHIITHVHVFIHMCPLCVCSLCVCSFCVFIWYVCACVRVHTRISFQTQSRTCMRQFTHMHSYETPMHARTSHAGWQAQDRGAMTHGPSMQTRTLIGMRFVKYVIFKKSWSLKTNKTDRRNQGAWRAAPASTTSTCNIVQSPATT